MDQPSCASQATQPTKRTELEKLGRYLWNTRSAEGVFRSMALFAPWASRRGTPCSMQDWPMRWRSTW